MNPIPFNKLPKNILKSLKHPIHVFENNATSQNIDVDVIKSFGEEWKKFHDFDEKEINRLGNMYFDILNATIINKSTYAIDIGCGTGRWSKYLANKVGFIEAIDPSDAIYTADKLLGETVNTRLSKASIDNIPFDDNTFDFAMSIGVLHHIPDTQKAMIDCVKKVKIGGYFYTYLYYDLENKGLVFKILLNMVTFFRKLISTMPTILKKITCDIIAILIYMPLILTGRVMNLIGLKKLALKLPLNIYHNQSFYVIRNDALDRFGTSLEQRFSKDEINKMMKNAGLSEITIAETLPYWHAVGKRIK